MDYWIDEERKIKSLINFLRDPMNKNKRLKTHMHNFIEIEYVLSGTGFQNINNVEYPAKRGDLFFINKGDSHSYRTDSEMEILNIVFYHSIFKELCSMLYIYDLDINFPTVTYFEGKDIFFIEQLLLNAEAEFLMEKEGYFHILKSSLSMLLIYIWRSAQKPTYLKNKKFIDILNYIEIAPFNLSIHDVASKFEYSDDYFSTLFKREIGITFTEYINKKRVNKSIELLTTTNMTIEAICLTIGLNEKKHFYNIFKKYTGKTPGEFRKNPQ